MRLWILHHKKYILIGLGILIVFFIIQTLFSKKTDIPTNNKSLLYIVTQEVNGSVGTGSVLEKRGEIKGSSDIIITAQVPGRVEQIIGSLGDVIDAQGKVIQLKDVYGAYSYASQRAGISVESAKNSYQQQVENLDKQMEDAQLAYERAQLQVDITNKDVKEQLAKAAYDLENTSDTDGSSRSLQVQKLEKDLEKAQFDYDTKLKSDDQTRTNFVSTAKNIHNDVVLLMQDVLYETDKILGITPQNSSLNDTYESSLSATDTSYLYTARDTFLELQNQEKQLGNVDGDNITIENVEHYLTMYSSFLQPVNNMLDVMEKVLTHTTAGSSLTQTQLDLLKTQFDGYQTKSQATISSITAQLNTINSFFATYEEQQASLAKSIDLLKDQIEITKKSLEDAEFTTQIGFDRTKIGAENSTENAFLSLKGAENTFDFLKNTKNSSLESIANARKQAELAYAEATSNLAKFSVESPIQGTISDIFVDKGQDVAPGTPLFRVVSDQQEIEIVLLANEYDLVDVGQEVRIKNDDDQEVAGILVSKSDVGDANGGFKAIIQLEENRFNVGTYAQITIPLSKKALGIPINAVRVVDNGIGEIFMRNGTEIKKQTISLGQLLGSNIEVTSPLPKGYKLVLTSLETYDPNIHTIVEKEEPY